MICVTWNDAKAYIEWINEQAELSGAKRYRLLTEAEWEYAARAVTDSSLERYPWGKDPDHKEMCRYANGADLTAKKRFSGWTTSACEDGHVFTARTTAFPPNAFGLCNMHGNVWEWVEDCYKSSYEDAPVDGSAVTGCGAGKRRVLRGGSWIFNPQFLRSAGRFRFNPELRSSYFGFRIARTL